MRYFLSLSSWLLVGVVCAAEPASRLHYHYPVPAIVPPQDVVADVCVYGGTPGGVATAVQAARMGKKAVLLAFNTHVGGMTSGGLTATDVGNGGAIAGIAREFFDKVGKLRGYRPSEAEKVFLTLLKDAGVTVYFEHRLKSVRKDGTRLVALTCENGNTFTAKMFADATYEGDLFAAAGVSFHAGREGNDVYKETINGVQFHNAHNFNFPVDPYQTEGDPKSGLLWGISPDAPGKAGTGDSKIQAYNFRMWLTNASSRLPWPKPADYDPKRYALLLRYLSKKPAEKWTFGGNDGPFQLHAGDCNNSGGFSTDMIGANYAWPTGDYATREKIYQAHVNYQQGLMYFMAHEPTVPEVLRAKVNQWGLPPDEFRATGGWPHELYVREGRRMLSAYVMTEANCRSKTVVEDSVGLASYNMDSHNCQRVVINGVVRNEGDVQIKCPQPYPISYRSIVPHETECTNLFVPVSLSSSHIAYGSIRMEPVFMILGQSAGTAAVFAIDNNVNVQQVKYAQLKDRLLADKQVLTWPAPKGKS
jgi:hypothetical protein